MNHPELRSAVSRKPTVFIFISAVTFLLLLFYACVHIFEFDEGWSYMAVKSESFLDLITYKHFDNANNHVINSLWMKILQMCGIKDMIFYRALSLVSFLFYSYFLYKIATRSVTVWQSRHDWLLVLFYMPTVIFFFASGRGYGMAIAFFCGALYYLKVYLEEKKQKAYWLFILSGMISSIAIVSFYFPFVAMVIFLYWKIFPFRVFTKENIIGGILLLILTLYIYYVGNRIIDHDVLIPGTTEGIINGTNNLFLNGMYSTFVGSLSLYYGVFPDHNLYVRYHLLIISKILILVTALPVIWIIVSKYVTKYSEYIILAIMTLLFFLTHLLLKSKYPSDRSASYLLYLIYLPVIYHIAVTKSKFLKLHYFTVLFFGLINLFSFLHELTKPNIYSALKKLPEKQYMILSDWPNHADDVHNEFYFKNRFTFKYLVENYEPDSSLIDQKVRLAAADSSADLILLQEINYLRNKSLFSEGYNIQPVISSNSKDFYLLERKR